MQRACRGCAEGVLEGVQRPCGEGAAGAQRGALRTAEQDRPSDTVVQADVDELRRHLVGVEGWVELGLGAWAQA